MKAKKGERIIQVVLLIIIAGGFAGIALTLKGNTQGGGMPGGPGAEMGAGAPGMAAESGAASSPGLVAVEAAEAEKDTVSQFIRVNGDVESDVSVDIYSDTAGKLVERRINLGSYVHKGDVIGIVDPSVPGEVYSKSPVYSTITGTVTAVNVNVGDTVTASSPIAVIGDLENLSVVTYIPERYVTNLKVGLHAEVAFEAFGDTVFQARVVQLNPVVDTESRSLEIKLEIMNPDSRIRAGMFASMKLITKESVNCIAIPLSSVSTYYDDSVVYVLDDSNTARRRVVETGLSSETNIEILEGLTEGERVVTAGVSSITDGTQVRVVNDPLNGED